MIHRFQSLALGLSVVKYGFWSIPVTQNDAMSGLLPSAFLRALHRSWPCTLGEAEEWTDHQTYPFVRSTYQDGNGKVPSIDNL